VTWIDKSEEEIRNQVLIIAREETGLSSFKEGGVLRGLIETYSKSVYSLYQDVMNFYGGQFTYLRATGTMLDLRGRELGVLRREARKTKGVIQIIATKSGNISQGVWFVTNGGLRYKTSAEITFQAGRNNVAVEAEFPGAVYNILPGTLIRSTAVLDGISGFTIPSGWITTQGRDDEFDEDYRKRIGAKWDSLGTDNRIGKYETIALSIKGIDDVKVIRAPRGSGSLDVVIASYASSITEAIITAFRDALADSYLLTRNIEIKSATPKNQEFVLNFSGSASKVQVQNTLRIWLQRRRIGENVTMHSLYKDVLSQLDIDHFEFEKPTSDIMVDEAAKIEPTSIVVNREE